MILKVSYNNKTKDLIEALSKVDNLELECYNEDNYKEKRKSYMLKSSFSARLTPFAVLFEDQTIKKAFYSEAKECTIANITNYLKSNYG